jgi:hypothetical protein
VVAVLASAARGVAHERTLPHAAATTAGWDFPADHDHPDVVPPMLAYADLVATHEPRNLDAAQLLYERKMTHALRQT